jgi:hypothetical protein
MDALVVYESMRQHARDRRGNRRGPGRSGGALHARAGRYVRRPADRRGVQPNARREPEDGGRGESRRTATGHSSRRDRRSRPAPVAARPAEGRGRTRRHVRHPPGSLGGPDRQQRHTGSPAVCAGAATTSSPPRATSCRTPRDRSRTANSNGRGPGGPSLELERRGRRERRVTQRERSDSTVAR